MKQMIQKTTRIGLSLFLLAVLVAGFMALSGTPEVLAAPGDVVVTVSNTNSVLQAGLPVYVFNGTTYAGMSAFTDVNGQVTFTLPDGNYNFRADLNGTQFFSGGTSGIDTCTVPGCTVDSVTVTVPTVVTVLDTGNVPQAGLNVYDFIGTTYTGKSGLTDTNGQVSFTLTPGDHNFRADLNAYHYFSGGASGVNTCTVPGCTADMVIVGGVCPAGAYDNGLNCVLADPGYFVPAPGAITQTACPVGTF